MAFQENDLKQNITPKVISLDGKNLTLVFFDDFENGKDRWETTDDNNWKLLERNGNNVFGIAKRKSEYQPKFRSPHNIALIKHTIVKDFSVRFKVKSTRDTGDHRDCCVFFGYQDPENFYYAHLGARPDPASGQIMIVNNAPRRPLTKNKNLVPWDDEWHNVMVNFDSANGVISVYFDNMKKPLMTARDKTFSSGRIGIGSFDDMNAFDDIQVYAKH